MPHGHSQQRSTVRLRLRQLLHMQIRTHLDDADLRMLCFDLGIDHENLGTGGKDDRIRELILMAVQQRFTEKMLARLVEIRPAVDWPSEID